jgi:predicted nucleotidyltransferase
MGLQIDPGLERIQAYCTRWKIRELAFFGSVLRDDFRPTSDVDVLVSFEPDARWSLLDLTPMRDELSELLGRPADLVTRAAVESSRNRIRRQGILESAVSYYVAG